MLLYMCLGCGTEGKGGEGSLSFSLVYRRIGMVWRACSSSYRCCWRTSMGTDGNTNELERVESWKLGF